MKTFLTGILNRWGLFTQRQMLDTQDTAYQIGRFHVLDDLIGLAKKNYGLSADKWAEIMYNRLDKMYKRNQIIQQHGKGTMA